MDSPVDIIIPVYRGEPETRRCLASALAARNAAATHLVVIDDASPEPAISAWLRELASQGRIELVAHAGNRGFVASVNEGMARHPDRDVILLNSDTEVADGWADRLLAHARADATVGTATPLSNNATICSYPRALEGNALPPGETTASLDAAAAAANAGVRVDVPTGVGFCMLVTRRCLDAVGTFDLARYGHGYGEEVDFCLRAARAGFRNVAAADVFVRHVGEVSFGGTGLDRRARAQETVDTLYPEFQPRLRAFLDADPLLPARRRLDLARLARAPRPRVLLVSHAFGGGVRRHVVEQARALEARAEVLLLQPNETLEVTRSAYVKLRWMNAGEAFTAWFRQADEWPALVALLQGIGVSRMHLHHVHGLPPQVLDLPAALGCAHHVTAHDSFAFCPQYHCLDGSARYCGEPAGCGHCEELGPAQWPGGIGAWRERFAGFLRGAERIVAPSQDAARRLQRWFAGLPVVVQPHAGARASRPVLRVLVAGALSPEKGLAVVEACARLAQERGDAVHFIVAGYTARPLPAWPALPITLLGEYPEGRLPELLAHVAPDVVMFPAQCPETHSYTLGDALAAGVAIVASDLGALPERLAGRTNARVVPWNAPAQAWLDALQALAPRVATHADAPRPTDPPSPPDLPLAPPKAKAMPPLQDGWWRDPREPSARPTFAQLYEDGVLCGRQRSREALLARGLEIERDLAHHVSLAQAAHARLGELQASTTWRLTAPLRRLVTWLRGSG